ncbi:MAG: alpha-amylase family glycosyl hydrolase, partial [Bacteroidota bacterium]
SKYLHATPIGCIDTNIIVHIEGSVSNTIVLWQNSVLPQNQTLLYGNRLMITIPIEAKKEQRSFIRCYCYSENSMAQDILIPLENGKVVQDTKQLTRNDKEAQIIYFILLDRFYNGNTKNDRPVSDSDIHAKLNFHGGDIAGVTQKIKDGYIPLLGVNTLWISPIAKNPEGYVEKNNHKFTGYHGYWPIDSEKIDDRFGTEQEMHEMVSEAHTRNISIILDYVANHVHKDNPIYAEHHERATNLFLPDGSMNIGRWEEHRYTTWFDDFLPTLDFDIPEVLEMMTDIAVSWIKKYNLDGFRHDATKHISTKFWRTLTKKLKHEIMIKESRRLYQIGETFGGRDMLQSYINSGIQDGQFSFNVYYELRNTFLYEDVPFSSLTTAILQDIQSFGAHNLMGNITGNHDMPRFISYAGEDLAMNQNAEHEGWNRHITVKNPVGYKKLQLLTVCVATIPGIPVIYYGDEIGMAGGGDPDNRRPMRFEKLNKHELENLSVTRKILQFRNHSLALIYGDFFIIHEDAQQLVYSRTYFCSTAIIILNKASVKATVSCKLPNILCKHEFSQLEDIAFSLSSENLTITMPPYSYQILYTQKDCSEPSAFHNSDKSFFNLR